MLYIILVIIKIARGEWVEIAPIYNGPNISVGTPAAFYDATPSSYEFVMKTPIFKTVMTTTPAYKTYQDTSISKPMEIIEIYNETILSNKNEPFENLDNGHYRFLTFLQEVQNNLLKSASRRGKLSFLINLKDIWLRNIYTNIFKLWKPKSQKKSESRGYKSDNDMDFPSNEGALMTIGFLTFAVFLIKIVIKLIQTLKNKYMYYGTTTTTTPATVLVLKRKKRDEHFEEMAKINMYIDKLPY